MLAHLSPSLPFPAKTAAATIFISGPAGITSCEFLSFSSLRGRKPRGGNIRRLHRIKARCEGPRGERGAFVVVQQLRVRLGLYRLGCVGLIRQPPEEGVRLVVSKGPQLWWFHRRGNEDTQLYEAILPAELTNKDIRNSKSYKKYYVIASGKIPPKTKASKKKADSNAPTKQKSRTVPKEKKGKKTGKGKQKAKELKTISEATLIEVEQLKIITKRSRVPDAPDYDSDDDISWKSSEDDQDDDKNDDDENVQDDEDDDKNDNDDDGDDFIHPKLTTHDNETTHEEETDEDDTFNPIVHTPSHVSSSDNEDSNNEVEGVDVEGEKSNDDATYVEDQGNEAGRDTNANLEGRDDVQTDVVLP
ncbi:hypothetical protein Tco_0992025 [Tanacetum coccineum]|uniref:Uncharacterized protein n=1 Tax=Tanacetum coccineum TaxID=301880 RepID=A0ABQ5F0W7_9ASTR